MNYTNLFNTLHSEVISEDVKEDIVSKVLDKVVLANEDLLEESINESNDKISSYVEALSLLVNSDITNEALEEAIDEIFSNETQEVIDFATEAFQEDVVRGILVEQLLEEEGLSEGSPAPIGLAGLRRAAGEEPIQRKAETQPKAQQPKQPTQQKPKQEPPKSQSKQAPKEQHLYVMKGADGSYRGARTKEMKDTVLKARKEAQRRAETPQSKTETSQPKEVNKAASRVEANKAKTAAKLSSTGFKEAIPLTNKVKEATKERKQKISKSTNTVSNIMKGISGVYSDETKAKLDKVKGNKGATKAVLHSKQAETEKAESKEPIQTKLDLGNTSTTEEKPKEKKPRALSLKQFNKLSKEEQEKQRKNLSKNAQKQLAQREENNKPVEEKPQGNQQEQPKETEVKKVESQEEEAPKATRDQELYTLRKDLMDMRNNGMKDTQEYKDANARYLALKGQNESLINSFLPLFKANLSEAVIKDICTRIGARRNKSQA